jgi:excisionase family DNA binding protein
MSAGLSGIAGSDFEPPVYNQSDLLKFSEGVSHTFAHRSTSGNTEFVTHLLPRKLPIGAGRLFTVAELAARWSVCTATVYGLAKAGRLTGLRVGNSIRFPEAEVEGYEEARVGAAPVRRKRRRDGSSDRGSPGSGH